MAADQPAKWTIFCVVVDENSPFSIKIQPDATVDDLKDSIKAKNQPEFDGFAANRLVLFKVDVPAQDMGEACQQIAALGLPLSMGMNPVFELRDYYSEPPPKKTIHILVRTPGIRLRGLLQTTDWSTEMDHIGQRFRVGSLELHLQETQVVVLESDKWAPEDTGIQSVEFNLKDSAGNILLHFCPRGWEKRIVLSSRGGGGAFEEIENFDHFNPNSPNTIAFVNNSDNFGIYINKRLSHRYRKGSTAAVAAIDFRWRGANCFLSDPVKMKVYESVTQYLASRT